MIVLDKNNYHKVIAPLNEVGINNLFARAVVEGHVNGTINVDNADNPTSFYIRHPYGMSLLFGTTTNQVFNSWLFAHALNLFRTRDRFEWLQAYPEKWNEQIATQWEEYLIKSEENTENVSTMVEVNTRVNFKFNKEKYLDFKCRLAPNDFDIVQTDVHMFEQMKGSVIPSRFWDSAIDFDKRAIAFSVMVGDVVACTAFSAFVVDQQLEIGIETADNFRGKGYAIGTCCALIDYCLENDFEPVWGCKLENTPSYLLAQKLGFEPTIYWPFYRLND